MKISRSNKPVIASDTPKVSKRVMDWVKNHQSVEGSYTFDDKQFFTRDDEIEYIELPLEDMIRKESRWHFSRNDKIHLRAYIDDNNKLAVDCDIVDCGYEFTLETQIDMRKIRAPKDIEKYVPELFKQFDKKFTECLGGLDPVGTEDVAIITGGEMLSGDREFNSRPLKDLKKGAWFTLKPIAEPAESQVWVKGDYDRIDKEFCCHSLDDINRERFFKATRLVYDDNNFEI